MTDEMTDLFDATEDGTKRNRALDGTGQLTQMASEITTGIFKQIEGQVDERREQVLKAQKNHAAMDQLINELVDFDALDVEFLRELSEETIQSMLKSQQSKRSRTKGKPMTLDNFRSLTIGAVAENLIRFATGHAKLAGGTRRMAGDVGFTEEQLAVLVDDQDELKRELRNIQSKKSIAKSKDGFSEEDEHWQNLLVAEAALKDIRVSTGRTKTVEVDTTKDALSELIALNLPPKELAKRVAELAAPAAE